MLHRGGVRCEPPAPEPCALLQEIKRVCDEHARRNRERDIVILSGDIVEAEDIVVPIVREELVRRNLPETIEGLRIVASPLGVDVRLKGAGCLAFLSTLNNPETLLRICRTEVPARPNDLHPASLHSEAELETSATLV